MITRSIAISTPLGEDVLLFHRMTAKEELGRLFRYEVDLLSQDPNIKFEKILGQNVTIRLSLPGKEHRYFNGYVSQFSQVGTHGIYHAYRAVVQPWLWFLTRAADCRIFQEMTVPDIIRVVCVKHGFMDIEDKLNRHYRIWEYCVQYRETDFNFISRLMEQEGIYYYFEHDRNKHTLVLADMVSSHQAFPGYEQITYYPPENSLHRQEDYISAWTVSQEVESGIYALNEFNFTQPKANLQVKASIARQHDRATIEVYDYPGKYGTSSEGEEYVRTRIEELQTEFERAQGQSNAHGLSVGSLFKLQGYPRKDQNREYLVVAATHNLSSDAYESVSHVSKGELYSNTFTAMHIQESFRPARLTPKPTVHGPQTAVVVGPSGQEIYTDKYGRVKVQFHWDREGQANEYSSCWVRVSQVWAGAGWGAIHIPRIGQEVVVDFLEGDPDQPLITGRVYNNDNMPPYALPDNATKSGIKSRSSKNGNPGNFNELCFEDKKGEELVSLQAEKNMDVYVKQDSQEWIGNDRYLFVKKDQVEQVEGDKHLIVQGNQNEEIGGTLSLRIGGDLQLQGGGNHAVDAAQEIHLKAGINIVIEAGVQISLKAGGSFIDIGPSGVTISGAMVLINSGGSAGSGTGVSTTSPKSAKDLCKGGNGQGSTGGAGIKAGGGSTGGAGVKGNGGPASSKLAWSPIGGF